MKKSAKLDDTFPQEIIDNHMRAVYKALEPIIVELDQGHPYSPKNLDHFFREVDQAREAWEEGLDSVNRPLDYWGDLSYEFAESICRQDSSKCMRRADGEHRSSSDTRPHTLYIFWQNDILYRMRVDGTSITSKVTLGKKKEWRIYDREDFYARYCLVGRLHNRDSTGKYLDPKFTKHSHEHTLK